MGVIEGGWEFVWAAYGISSAWLALYGSRSSCGCGRSAARQEREAVSGVVP